MSVSGPSSLATGQPRRICLKRTLFIFTLSSVVCAIYFSTFHLSANLFTPLWVLSNTTTQEAVPVSQWRQPQAAASNNTDMNNRPLSSGVVVGHPGKRGANLKETDSRSSINQVVPGQTLSFVKNESPPPSVPGKNATVQSVTAKLSFDPDQTVTCHESVYVQCSAESAKHSPVKTAYRQRVFNVAWLRKPRWQPSRAYDFSSCEYNACRYVDTNVTEETDVVVLYAVGLGENFNAPQRWPHQLYVASAWESPLHMRSSFVATGQTQWNRYYNLTMTYRTDSDIFVPYGKLVFDPAPVEKRPNYYEIAQKKTRPVAWLVSNCGAPSKRQDYVQEMQKYIPVDIYGACGQPCGGDCSSIIDSQYKFYLAFENSFCTDYVTEKLFKLYHRNSHIIPVVRGAANYDKYFPKSTFINTADFPSAKDLALYLKDLAGDLPWYSQLLEYKEMYVSSSFRLSNEGCELCKYLHTRPQPVGQIYDLKTWMIDDHCHKPTDV